MWYIKSSKPDNVHNYIRRLLRSNLVCTTGLLSVYIYVSIAYIWYKPSVLYQYSVRFLHTYVPIAPEWYILMYLILTFLYSYWWGSVKHNSSWWKSYWTCGDGAEFKEKILEEFRGILVVLRMFNYNTTEIWNR